MLITTIEATGKTLSAIFITHGHSDHMGATVELAAATGARVYGSDETAAALGSPADHQLFPGMPLIAAGSVDEILTGGEIVEIGSTEVQVIATPGHSPGSLTYFADGSIFCGDLLFHGSVGRTDLPGGSFEQLASSVKQLILRYPADTVIYPGHGNTSTLEQEKENNPFLTDLGW